MFSAARMADHPSVSRARVPHRFQGFPRPRGRAHVDLRMRERLSRGLFEATPDAVLVVGRDGAIVDANGRVGELFGYAPGALLGRPLELLVPERLREAHALFRSLYFEAPAPRPMGSGHTFAARRADASEFPAEISLAPVDAGCAVFVVAFVRDVTKRREFEEKLQQAQKLEAVGQLAAGIAHDFNNLLTAIGGYAALLADGLAGEEQLAADAAQIVRATASGSELTRRILAFTRSEPHRAVLVDLVERCRESRDLLSVSLGERIALEVVPRSERLVVEIDPSLFEQALLNLALNARDAMPDGGALTLVLSRVPAAKAGGRALVRLDVSDTGHGMDEETRRRAFEPFFTTKERDRGTGLGLAAVWGIVAAAGGEARIASTVGGGTTVTVLLPEASGPLPEPDLSPPRAVPVEASGKTVLIVEDDEAVRALTGRVLAESGYRCLVARSGTQALGMAADHGGPIDLLVTDVVLPGIPSGEVAERLRARFPNLRVLVTSGYAGEEIARSDTPFLPKPFTPDTLLQAVREALAGPRPDGRGTLAPLSASRPRLVWQPSPERVERATITRYRAGWRAAGCRAELRRALALVGRRHRGVLGLDLGVLRRRGSTRRTSACSAVARCPARSGSRARGSTTPSTSSAAATTTRSRSATPRSCGRSASVTWGELREQTARIAAGAARRSASARATASRRTCRTSPRRSPRSSRARRIGAVWSCGRAGVRRAQRRRPLRPDRAEGAARGRRLPLRREGLRPARGGRASSRRDRRARAHGRARPYLDGAAGWEDVLSARDGELAFAQLPFDHPLWVLYSLRHDRPAEGDRPRAGRDPARAPEEARTSTSTRSAGDRVFWFTTTGWMMWNFLVGVLLDRRVDRALRRQPRLPGPRRALGSRRGGRRITCFGTSAALHRGLHEGGRRSRARVATSPRSRSVGSTGSPLAPEGFDWVYDAARRRRLALLDLGRHRRLHRVRRRRADAARLPRASCRRARSARRSRPGTRTGGRSWSTRSASS